jgi:hypothetical protein
LTVVFFEYHGDQQVFDHHETVSFSLEVVVEFVVTGVSVATWQEIAMTSARCRVVVDFLLVLLSLAMMMILETRCLSSLDMQGVFCSFITKMNRQERIGVSVIFQQQHNELAVAKSIFWLALIMMFNEEDGSNISQSYHHRNAIVAMSVGFQSLP